MGVKIFLSLICASCLLLHAYGVIHPDIISVNNCIFNCSRKIWIYQIKMCAVDCNEPTSFIDKNYNIDDIFNNNDAKKMNWLTISSNNIFEFNINYFCSTKNYQFDKLYMNNNKLNDSSKLGLGDINNCEDDNSKCKYTISKLQLDNSPFQVLKNHSFCHLKRLSILTLTNCSLNSIEADAFKFNNKLKELNLDENKLTEIPHLGHLSSLKTLDTSKNLITSIRNEDFLNCHELEVLYLNGNRINNIEDKAFDQLRKLNALHLQQNQLTTISKTFGKLNAYYLTVNNNLLKEFDILDFSKNLKYFSANKNIITNVSSDLRNSQLIIIDLSENKIKSIHELQLPITAKSIHLNKNELQSFSIQPLNRTYSLRYINLKQNKLQIVLNDGLQAEMYALDGNPLVCSCENSWLFSDPKEINKMYKKPCSSINKYNPIHHSIFNELMLCESNFNNSNRCRIKHSNESQFQCQFKCLNPCYCYTTADFSIAHYYCSNSQLQLVPQWVNSRQLHEQSIVIMLLDGNNFSVITNVSFFSYYNVTQLFLNNSLIEVIDHLAFNDMIKLTLLDLSHNLLTTIEENTFDQMIHLEKLLLSNNKLKQLPDNCFDNLNSLQYLYLHDNKLTNYPVWNLEKLSSITELTINNNPWNCNYKNISKIDKVSINIQCGDSTIFSKTKHDIDDIMKINSIYNYSSINAIELIDSNLMQLQTNFFCPIDIYNLKHLNIINNQLNDSTKIGFGDSNNCSSMSKCKFQILETLILNGNPLKILKNNSFCHMNKLKELYLSNCSLKTIEADAFLNLDKLQYLNLNGNVFKKIPIVLHLNSLTRLSISNNTLNSIQNIERFEMLQSIDLSYNIDLIDSLDITKVIFMNHKNFPRINNEHLKFLNLSHVKLSYIDLLYIRSSSFEILDLNYNLFSYIPKTTIMKTIQTLHMRGNLITELEPDEIDEMLNIKFIDLSRNQIVKVNLPKLPPKLETLDLSNNKINQLLIFKSNNTNIKEINLSNNSLNILPQTDIESNIFNLTNNPIACTCENSWLSKYPHWNQIIGQQCEIVNKFNPENQTTLSSNMLCESNYKNSNRCLIEHQIEYQFQCQFKCPFPFYCYTTDDFSIAHYYCSNNQLQSIPQWVNSGHLNSKSEVIVWLNGNNFSEIRNENFTDYDNVTQLYLRNSQITLIDHLTFSTMTKLKVLDLSYNQLTKIEDGTFNFLINLQKLILSHNLIAYLPDNLFNYTNNLTMLQLHDNKLTNYSLENLSNRPILKEITLHNNNWTCNCNFIIEFQNFLNHHSYSVEKQTEMYCVNEDGSLATSPINQYNISHCTDQNETTINNTWPIVISIVAPLCAFAIVYGFVHCFKSRASAKRVKQIECAYRLMQNAGTPIETDGKVFDVFISYSNEDSEFVATKIVPKLEDINDPYHVCVHERNFLGGGSIEDTIIEAIKKSTRIIVILTENYLQSDWCMYEFVIAHSVMIEDQCPRVVLIIKDEIPPDINPNLQIYLSTNTYIEWTDSKFWQRLYFALSSNKLPMEQTLQPMNFLMSTHFITPND
ncbi:TOLL-like receptor [Chamberlinius hualienensis]